MAKPKWITIGTTEGSMNGSSEITAAAYTGRVAREGTITGTTAGGASDTTAVSQVGAAEVITIDKKEYTASAVGQRITIQGKSNSAWLQPLFTSVGVEAFITFELSVNGEEVPGWNTVDKGYAISGDPGASAKYDFTLTVNVPENTSTRELKLHFKVQNENADVSDTFTIAQAAGVKNYATPVISAFAYPEGNIPASGGSKTPTLNYSQTWGWNESNTNGGTISGTLAAPASGTTFAFSGAVVNATTGVVTAASKGTVVSDVTEVDAVTVTVTLNGKTSASSASVSVMQAANAVSYGDITFSDRVPSVADVPASGGLVQGVTWSGEGAIATQIISYTSGSTVTISNDAGSETPAFNPISVSYGGVVGTQIASKGTAVSARTEAGVVTITAGGEHGKEATKSLTVYQAANSATYGDVTIGQATPVSLAAPGDAYQIIPAMKQTVTYTSGATRTELTPADNKVQLSADYVVKTPKEGFSIDANVGMVKVSFNPTTAPREGFIVTISAEGEGGKTATKDITFNQQGSTSTLDLSPDTMSFIAAGETKTLTIKSNDSWTLS